MSDITANVVVSNPSQLFTLARSFKANANGKIYIGKIDEDPVDPANRIQVYLENEDGSHVPVAQPLIINAGGYPVYNGQIAKFVTVEGHSMAIYNAYGAQEFYYPNVLKYDPDQLIQRLAGKDGYSYLGELQSVADFNGLVKQNGARVKLRSWYAGWAATAYAKPTGGGEFIYQAGVPKSKHDGCVYFSPTVPYSTSLSAYVTATGETDSSGVGVWVRDIANSTHILTDWAGINDGATISSSSAHADAVQKVFNAAAALGKQVQLGYGFIHLEKAVVMPAFFDNSAAMPRIEGFGINSSYFICTPLGTDIYNLTCMLGSIVQTWGMKDFQIREKELTKFGYLMKLGRLTGAVIERIKWSGGFQQLLAQSVLSCTWIEPCWFGGYRGAKFEAGGTVGAGYANPNAILMIRPQILSMENQGLWIVDGCQFKLQGGSIEGCGTAGDTTFRGIYVQGGVSDGTIGLVLDGVYIESNSGTNIYINHSSNRSARHKIINSNFNNGSPTRYPVNQVVVLGGNYAYPAGVKMVLEMHGNTCTGYNYTNSPSRPDVVITQYAEGQCEFIDLNNSWIPNQGPSISSTVLWRNAPNDSFRGLAAADGTLSNARNIVSVAKTAVGVYLVTCNHAIDGDVASIVPVATAGYAILNGVPAGKIFTYRTFNTSGVATDMAVQISGLTVGQFFSQS